MNMKKTNTLKGVNSMPAGTRIVTYICLAWALIVSLLPIGWLVLSSLKKDPMARPGFQLPESICLDGYISTFKDLHVMRYFGNSLFVAGVSVVISVVMISMSAYVVARMEFKGKALVNVLLYSTMFIPATSINSRRLFQLSWDIVVIVFDHKKTHCNSTAGINQDQRRSCII